MLRLCSRIFAVILLGLALITPLQVSAVEAPITDRAFSLQVTPSPLVTTLKPGQTTELELKIRNASTEAESLRMETRSFTVNQSTGEVQMGDTPPAEIKDWVSFASPNFTVAAGQWYTQKVRFSLPKNTGFSYSFAVIISRQKEQASTSGGRLIKGSVAVFTLVNVDRPGATRKLDVSTFSISKNVYEYLPAKFELRFKNTGNSIVAPYGNIFVQRGSNSTKPISTLTVNEQRGYILAGAERVMDLKWNEGFPRYIETVSATGTSTEKLTWNWSDMSQFRIGKYTAKLVAVYNNGGHDVPIQGEVSFWVVPWKIILGVLVVFLLMLFGLWSFVRKVISLFRKKSAPLTPTDTPKE